LVHHLTPRPGLQTQRDAKLTAQQRQMVRREAGDLSVSVLHDPRHPFLTHTQDNVRVPRQPNPFRRGQHVRLGIPGEAGYGQDDQEERNN